MALLRPDREYLLQRLHIRRVRICNVVVVIGVPLRERRDDDFHDGMVVIVSRCIGIVLLLGLVAWYWQSHEEHNSNRLIFASAVSASLLTGSHMFTHDFSPLILALFLVAGNFPKEALIKSGVNPAAAENCDDIAIFTGGR